MPLSKPLLHSADHVLPPAPSTLPDAHGQACCGRYAGSVSSIDWARLAPPYARGAFWRRFHHKRWQYVALSTEALFCGIAIVDLGWTSTAFAYAFDRSLRKEVAGYSQNGLPGLGAQVGATAGDGSVFRHPGSEIRYRVLPRRSKYQLSLRCRDFAIDAEFAAAAAPLLLAVGPIAGGSVHATQKSSGMPLSGEVRIPGQRYRLDGGVASFDYSNGLLARETAWQWASAHSLDLGFNLQAGYFGGHENALWLDGRLIPLGPARFDYDRANPLAPWRVHTEDGLLDLQFTPEGARREDKNLLIAASRYIQPIGTFSGWVRPEAGAAPHAVKRLAGVTEDHYSRW